MAPRRATLSIEHSETLVERSLDARTGANGAPTSPLCDRAIRRERQGRMRLNSEARGEGDGLL